MRPSREHPVDGAQGQLLEQLRERGEISSQLAGHLHQGPSASLLLSAAALRVIGRRWRRDLASAGVLAAGEQPDTWTLPKEANR